MAILYGTQSNGETLPVLVDQFGNLIAKGIEGPPGQGGSPGTPGKDGEQGPQGEKGDPGEGVPVPYGEEDTVLVIKNGAPVWGDYFPPPPPDPIVWTNVSESSIPSDNRGREVDVADPLEWAKEQSTWMVFPKYDATGLSIRYGPWGNGFGTLNLEFNYMDGEIMHLHFNLSTFSPGGGNVTPSFNITCSEPNIQLINNDIRYSPSTGGASTYAYACCKASFLFKRNVASATFTVDGTCGPGYTTKYTLAFTGYEKQDSGTYALERQVELERKLKALRGMTMDIDLLRPKQD